MELKTPWYRQLHWQIIIGLVTGLIFGLLASKYGWGKFTTDWVKPWGTIFINLLKMIAVPLILASLISGVASLSDISKLYRIGGKTIAIYLGTTVLAVSIGLLVVNVVNPGHSFPRNPAAPKAVAQTTALMAAPGSSGLLAVAVLEKSKSEFPAIDMADLEKKQKSAKGVKDRGPLQPLVDMVPPNVVQAATNNRQLLQMVFVAIFVGIALIRVDPAKGAPVRSFFEGLNEVIIEVVNLIMKIAPIGVFALIASVITDLTKDDPTKAFKLLWSLSVYGVTVVVGLCLQICLVYLVLLKLFTRVKIMDFLRAIRPAQLLAFSTSSSAATLPVTKECCETGLGVSPEITSFTLPLGATVNMDGTALYQAVAAVFIAQVLGIPLSFGAQVMIVVTATLASIGTAAVPSAGIIMLVIILEAIGVPSRGIALILGIDRILDMLRTVTNITGDAVVTTIVAHTEGKLDPPGSTVPEATA